MKTDSFPDLRDALRKRHGVAVPSFDPFCDPNGGYDDAAHRLAFGQFLQFVKKNLAGQTSLRVDPAWASQLSLLQGVVEFGPPDMIVREDRLAADLAILAAQIGRDAMPAIPEVTDPHAPWLSRIVDVELNALARDVYQRDYVTFGFGDWDAA